MRLQADSKFCKKSLLHHESIFVLCMCHHHIYYLEQLLFKTYGGKIKVKQQHNKERQQNNAKVFLTRRTSCCSSPHILLLYFRKVLLQIHAEILLLQLQSATQILLKVSIIFRGLKFGGNGRCRLGHKSTAPHKKGAYSKGTALLRCDVEQNV